MNSTRHPDLRRFAALKLAIAMGLAAAVGPVTVHAQPMARMTTATPAPEVLSAQHRAIVPIAAFGALGDIPKLNGAINAGLDAGLTISDAREVLIQLYAYAGFPRSLNALTELMKVVETRRARGIQDAPGKEPSRPIPKGGALRKAGAANQTKLVGRPVAGPVFDFAPAVAEYLQTHLFGDIFERDNLDWKSREIATVSMLSTLPGAEPQLQSHFGYSINVGISPDQLRSLCNVLTTGVGAEQGNRAKAALEKNLSAN